MYCTFYLAAFASIASALSLEALPKRQADESFTCDVKPTQDFLDYSEELRVQESNEGDFSTDAVITVNTWFHVVAVDRTPGGGWVSVSSAYILHRLATISPLSKSNERSRLRL